MSLHVMLHHASKPIKGSRLDIVGHFEMLPSAGDEIDGVDGDGDSFMGKVAFIRYSFEAESGTYKPALFLEI